MLHAVRLERGRATGYRSRWMRATRGPNTSVVRHAGRILALVETSLPVEVDARLETVGPFDFDGGLSHSMLAHPKRCPTTGELLFISCSHERPFFTYYRADARGRIVHRAPIAVPAATYRHDMAITDRHVVFWDLPVLLGEWRSPRPLVWAEDYPARIGVLRRDGSSDDVVWFEIAPCMISHTMNAFEDGSLVVLDVVRSPRLMSAAELYRYTFDLQSGRATECVLSPRFVDFPRVHPDLEGKSYRYGYGLELSEWETGSWQRTVLRKFTMDTGDSSANDLGADRMAGECAIAPRRGAGAEDDAWAIALVVDRRQDASELVILDAQRFHEPPVARVRLPCRVPVGLHGAWLPDED
jgi:carotenoid cleavage dioxygenase